jgi:hypothetical protein
MAGSAGKETSMVIEETTVRCKGFIVGSSNGGKKWAVRVKDEGHPLDGKKLNVATVCVGTTLRPGLDVIFDIRNNQATDVEETVTTKSSKKKQSKDDSSLNFIACKLGSKYFVTWTSADSREEAQEQLIKDGGDEVVVDLLRFSPEDDGGNTTIISALMSSDGSFLETLEELLSKVYLLGRYNHYYQQGE